MYLLRSAPYKEVLIGHDCLLEENLVQVFLALNVQRLNEAKSDRISVAEFATTLMETKKEFLIVGNLIMKGKVPRVSKKLGSVIQTAARWVEQASIKKGEKIGEGWAAEVVAAIKI